MRQGQLTISFIPSGVRGGIGSKMKLRKEVCTSERGFSGTRS